MTKLAAARGDKVLCIDNTKKGDLFRSLHSVSGDEDIKINDIRYARFAAWTPDVFNAYDTVIIYQDYDIDPEIWDGSTTRFVMADTDKYHLIDVRDALKKVPAKNITLLIMDAYFEKLHEDDMPDLLEVDTERILGLSVLPFEPEDLAALQAFQFNGLQRIGGTSKSMQEFLMEVYGDVYGEIKKKDFKKLAAKAR